MAAKSKYLEDMFTLLDLKTQKEKEEKEEEDKEEEKLVSIDVECAATGRGHNDRAPCRIAAVDGEGRGIFNRAVLP